MLAKQDIAGFVLELVQQKLADHGQAIDPGKRRLLLGDDIQPWLQEFGIVQRDEEETVVAAFVPLAVEELRRAEYRAAIGLVEFAL